MTQIPGDNRMQKSTLFDPDPDRTWKVNRGYSVFIRVLRKSFIFIALLLIGIVIAWLVIFDVNRSSGPETGSQAEGEAALVKARYDGVDNQSRPYRITADRAVRVSGEGGLVELEQPLADIFLSETEWMAARSDTGSFSQKTEILNLQENVKLFYDAGMEFSLSQVSLDLKAGTAVSDQPVEGQGPSGRIKAMGILIEDGGYNIIFTGPAQLRLRPQSTGAD